MINYFDILDLWLHNNANYNILLVEKLLILLVVERLLAASAVRKSYTAILNDL
ncbi:MAG: hypothetical protein MGG11_20600 [Trichodesmium sp. MAG_R03]|nr:hypothetical protein [Trichodesmium sp. MAG_R03]